MITPSYMSKSYWEDREEIEKKETEDLNSLKVSSRNQNLNLIIGDDFHQTL